MIERTQNTPVFLIWESSFLGSFYLEICGEWKVPSERSCGCVAVRRDTLTVTGLQLRHGEPGCARGHGEIDAVEQS